MAASGVSVSAQCMTDFNALKLQKAHKYIIFKLSDDLKEIEVESTSSSNDYEEFRERLLNAKSKDKRGNTVPGARYAVYDLQKDLESEGTRNKITFITWISGDVPVGLKMVYSSSKEALKRALSGIAADIQANDEDDLEKDSLMERAFKGGR